MNPLLRLALGASLGGLCAILVLLGGSGSHSLDDSAVASVNGIELELAQYRRALRMFASEKREPITEGDRSLILERMIEEELLLHYGVESGLVRSDPAVRAEVVRSVVTSLMTELEARNDKSSPEQAREVALAEYIGQLRKDATIRWAAAAALP